MADPGAGDAGSRSARILQHPRNRSAPASDPAASAAWSERWFGRVFGRGPATFVADARARLIYANEAYRQLAHANDPERCAAPGEPALTPEATLRHVLETGGEEEHEHRLVVNRSESQVVGHYWPITAPYDETDAVVGVFHAVRLESIGAELRLARARFADIARLTSDWVWEVDETFNFTFVSPRFAELMGLPARLLVGFSLFECGDFDGFAEANRGHHPAPDSRVPFRDVFYRMVGTDDRPRLFRLSGVPVFEDSSGDFQGYRGTATDVTEATEAEARLTEAQTRLIHAIETMPQGFALYDSQDRLVLCNSQYEQFLAPHERMIAPGVHFADLMRSAAERGLFPGDRGALDRFIEDQLARHKLAAKDMEIKLADESWVLITSEMTEGGGIIEVWNDITKMKNREAALRAAEEASRRAHQISEIASRAKTEFLANMSHELRTPLNAIIGFSEILKNQMFGPLGSERYYEYAQDIYGSGTHLLGVINDILEFAKAEAGKLELSEEKIELPSAVDACLRLLRPRAAEAGVMIDHDLSANLPKLRADETKLRQILLNLLSNSVKFTESGGSVRVSARADPEIGYEIVVADTGIGISEDDIPKALSAFGQVDSALSRKFDGTGLGLPLCTSMIELHGGTMTLESTVGKGTTVTVRLPSERIVVR